MLPPHINICGLKDYTYMSRKSNLMKALTLNRERKHSMISSGYTPIYNLISPLYLEKIEERVNEGGYHRSTNSNGTEGQNSLQMTYGL